MNLKVEEFFDAISNLDYVVQRNWDGIARGDFDDIDLFVAKEHFDRLNDAAELYERPELVDIRTEGDGYYPVEIEKMLLKRHRMISGMKIPSPEAAFICLYYHGEFHKKQNKYYPKLKELFAEWIPPTQPDDTGVEFNP